jgi:hypothetical protein
LFECERLTDKLCEVPVGVGVLSPEDPAHGVHSLKVPGNGHLLVQLGRLGQVRGALEVGHLQQDINAMLLLSAELDNIITVPTGTQ